MFALLLVIIYIAFISLGLPDSLIGSAWPIIHNDLGVPISYAGIVTMIIASGTVIASLMTDRLTKKMGSGVVTTISVFLTATALIGFSFANRFYLLCLLAIPYGLGAGAIDATLNNYVALHYSSRHMNWLHCFWGVGCSISPYIMSHFLINGNWHFGFGTVGIIQIVITFILLMSLPLWKKQIVSENTLVTPPKKLKEIFRIKGAIYIFIAFFSYSSIECTTSLWASSYLVLNRGVDSIAAARFASFFYLGITAGRLLSGFFSNRLGDKRMIRLGITILLIGITFVIIPFKQDFWPLAGFIIMGIGCAPIYPAIIHSTPYSFGSENSQALIGVQMASAYVGATLMPPFFGLLAEHINISLFPYFVLFFTILMLIMLELLHAYLTKVKNGNIYYCQK